MSNRQFIFLRAAVAASILLIAGSAGLACGEKTAEREYLVQNPDFEEVKNGLPQKWTRYVGNGHVEGWKELDAAKHQGDRMNLSTEGHKRARDQFSWGATKVPSADSIRWIVFSLFS